MKCIVNFFVLLLITTTCFAGVRVRGKIAEPPVGPIKPKAYPVVTYDINDKTIAGTLTKDQMTRVINAYMGQIQYCYEKQLMKSPDLKGDVSIKFNVNEHGRVNHFSIDKTTMENPPTETCLTGVIQRMPFSSTSGSTQVTIPFQFSLKEP
jgi:hypothetical protein